MCSEHLLYAAEIADLHKVAVHHQIARYREQCSFFDSLGGRHTFMALENIAEGILQLTRRCETML